jgi:hypoxanthine phosphoribosyltransferase
MGGPVSSPEIGFARQDKEIAMSERTPEVLISEEEIHAKVEELARRISADYRDVDDLILVGVLKGSFIFLADLARHLTVPRSVDFMALSTYGDATETDGAVRMIMDLRRNIAGQHVLIVEDIVDTGYTLAYLIRTLAARQPASLKTCVLVHKPERREVYAQIDYLGFEIPDAWVVGCGLDWAEKYRTLPYIGVVKPEE